MPSASPADQNPPPIAAESNRVLRRELWWFAGVTGSVWLVGFITNRLIAPDYAPFDHFVFMLMRSADDPANAIGPGWLAEAARDVTALGSWSILLAVTVTAAGYYAAAHNRLTASIIVGSSIGAMTLGELLKVLVDRARPDLAPHAVDVYTASFPIGHAMSAAAAYLTLGALAAAAQSGRAARAWLMTAAIAVTMLVGLSRIYLAVHWPTDERYTPIYLHCNLGSDRTGVAVAVYRMVVDGWPREEAIREMTQGPYGYNKIWVNLVDFLEQVDADALRQRLRDAPPLPPPGPVVELPAPAADTPAQRPPA